VARLLSLTAASRIIQLRIFIIPKKRQLTRIKSDKSRTTTDFSSDRGFLFLVIDEYFVFIRFYQALLRFLRVQMIIGPAN
jgi:hypothetical protein